MSCSKLLLGHLKPPLLNPNDTVAAVTLENEALLSAFLIAIAAVMQVPLLRPTLPGW